MSDPIQSGGQTEAISPSVSSNLLAPVLVVPEDTPEKLIQAALKAGYIPIPTKAPGYVQLLVGTSRWNGDDLMMAALEAIQGQHSERERSKCVEILWQRIRDKGANAKLSEPARKI